MRSQNVSKNDLSMKKLLGLFSLLSLLPLTANAQEVLSAMNPNDGVSFNSIMRGVLGMAVLLALAYAFSSKRKAIQWKTVGIGLAFRAVFGEFEGVSSGFFSDLKKGVLKKEYHAEP